MIGSRLGAVQTRGTIAGLQLYAKLAANDLAFTQLASIRLWLRVDKSTL
jgi:hypothetical protein